MHEDWKPILEAEFGQEYFRKLSTFLHEAYATNTIFPPKAEVFRAFAVPPAAIRVVILGQDPYHNDGQAHGLAFSVREGVPTPPSLLNIYKEIEAEFGRPTAGRSGHLASWAEQGVFLLNNTLTVEAHRAGSHRGLGWETFTANIIRYLSTNRQHLVFLLWGRDARAKRELIDSERHLILEAAHPSPLSAHNGFFGCNHFQQTNSYLEANGFAPICW